jgi:hypothetical protein
MSKGMDMQKPRASKKDVLERVARRIGGTRASLKARWQLDRAIQVERASGKTKAGAREAALKKLMRDPDYPMERTKRSRG